MAGFTNSDNSIANGIPARHISPETGSSGNATMTNKGGTSEGTAESYDPAAAIESPIATTAKDRSEARSFAAEGSASDTPFDPYDESPSQLIADGGDRIKHDHKDKSDR